MLVEYSAKRETGECRWHVVDRLVETDAKIEESEAVGKSVYRFVKIVSEREMDDCGWEIVDWLVEA